MRPTPLVDQESCSLSDLKDKDKDEEERFDIIV